MSKEAYQDVRVVHPGWFGFYDRFVTEWKHGMPGIKRWVTEEAIFKDGSPWLHVIKEGSYEGQVHALMPFWFLPKRPDCLNDILSMVNALTRDQNGNGPLADKVIGVSPYIEARMDKPGELPGGGFRTGEAITVEVLAPSLASQGMKEVATVDLHSFEAFDIFFRAGINLLNLTSSPLIAEDFRKLGLSKKDGLVSLDIGALQRNLRMAKLLEFDPKTQMVVFKKSRGGHNVVSDSDLRWGDPSQFDRLFYVDDIFDTGGSMEKTLLAVNEYRRQKGVGPSRNYIAMTHGIMSYPARDTLLSLIDRGLVSKLFLTNSLPKGTFNLRTIPQVEINPITSMLAFTARLISAFSVKQILEDTQFEDLQSFILQPRPKEKVWQEFYAQVTAC